MSVESSFYLTIVACVGVDSFVVPPMFIIPEQRLNLNVMDGCFIENSTISVASKDFMTAKFFLKWLVYFKK